mgnify:CR=1 FL=1
MRLFDEKSSDCYATYGSRWRSQFFDSNIQKIQFICLCYKEKSGPVISSWHSIYRPHMHNSAVGLQWQGAAHLYPFRSVFFFKTEPQTSDDYIVGNEVSWRTSMIYRAAYVRRFFGALCRHGLYTFWNRLDLLPVAPCDGEICNPFHITCAGTALRR